MKDYNHIPSEPVPPAATLYRRIAELERALARERGGQAGVRERERRLEDIVEALPVGIGLIRHRLFEWVSGPLLRTLGYTEPEVLGKSTRILYADDAEYERVGEQLYRQLERSGSGRIESRIRHRDGSLHDVQIHARPVDTADLSQGIIVTANDVTEARRALDQVQTLSRVVDQSPSAVMVTDAEGHIEYVNAAFERTTGYARDEVLGLTPELLHSGYVPNGAARRLQDILRSGVQWHGELHSRRKNGSLYWEHAVITPVFDRDGRLTHVVHNREDISRRKAHEERLLREANFDRLTGLPNRVLVLDRLRQAVAAMERSGNDVGVLMVDLDGFRKVGESLGREAGDRVLRMAAQRLKSALRSDDTVARIGGDEFLLVLPELHAVCDAQQLAEKVLLLFAVPFDLGHHHLPITASVGISHALADHRDPQQLIKNAESALYLAKQAGRNTYRFFSPELNRRAVWRLELESRLARALDRGELAVHYQPVMSCVSGRPVGVEALLRWTNGELGKLAPEEFIPLAEQTGLIDRIGGWVLEVATRQVRDWRRELGLPLRLAVNISARQFGRGDLVGQVERVLAASGLPAEALELEITETLLMRDEPQVLEQLQALRGLGVRLAVDDFGTGHASLCYLKRFPIDTLKIDRSFVRNLATETDNGVLSRTIILMGQGLGLDVVAEGVEAAAELDFLRGERCSLAQGFYFSPPLAAAECADWMRRELG